MSPRWSQPVLLAAEERLAASHLAGPLGRTLPVGGPLDIWERRAVLEELGYGPALDAEYRELCARRDQRKQARGEADRYYVGNDCATRGTAIARVLTRLGGFCAAVELRPTVGELSENAQRWYDWARGAREEVSSG